MQKSSTAADGLRINLPALRDFVLDRLQDDGGFAATPMLAHTIADTWHAVEVLAVLREVTGNDDLQRIMAHGPTRQYLRDFAAGRHALSARIKYQLAILLKRFDLRVDQLPPAGTDTSRFRSFEELLYLSRLGEKNLARPTDAQKDFLRLPLKSVQECFFYLTWQIEDATAAPMGQAEARETAGWLARAQNLDGGFGFYPGTTSFVENSCYALAALELLGALPRDPARAAAFIRSCQTGGGGFGRTPAAAPFLEDSCYAVRGLAILQAMGRRNP
jgi:hypothetical protein